MFPTNHVEYQRPENKGKCFNCKICQYKAEIKNKSYIRRIDGKFYRFEIKSKIKHLITILKS